MALREWLSDIVRCGVYSTTPYSERKYIVLVNTLVLLTGVMTLMFTPVQIVYGNSHTLVVFLATFVAAAGILLLNHRRRYFLAAAAFLLLCLVATTAQALLAAPAGVHLFLLVGIILPFLVFPPRYKAAAPIGSALFMAVFIALVIHYGSPYRHAHGMYLSTTIGVAITIAVASHYSRVVYDSAEAELERERRKSEALLLNILPKPIGERLKNGDPVIADEFPHVSVLFLDIVGFTRLSASVPAERMVMRLNAIFSSFDHLAIQHRLEKIKTIGDAYMVAAGLPVPRPDHAIAIAEMALDMRDAIGELHMRGGDQFEVRIGIHSGPVIAGVIGTTKFAYDLWGDTVNTAARMEQSGIPGEIQISETTSALLRGTYRVEERGTIEVKGKGPMRTFLLKGRVRARADG